MTIDNFPARPFAGKILSPLLFRGSGFTLLEILIAVSILAVILPTIYFSYMETSKIIDVTESQMDIYGMARIVSERMLEDLGSVYLLKTTDDSTSNLFVGKNKEGEGHSADTLRFLSMAHIVFSEEEENFRISEIYYYLKKDNVRDGFNLYRSDTIDLEEKPAEETGGSLLCNGLLSVDFTYYDSSGGEYDSWDSTQDQHKDKLPAIVSIMLKFINKADTEAPFKFITAVALPLAREKYGTTS